MKHLAVAVEAAGAVACWAGSIAAPKILAQTVPGLPEWANLSATALLGLLAVYLSVRTIPQMAKDFREELAAERAAREKERTEFLSQLKECRKD